MPATPPDDADDDASVDIPNYWAMDVLSGWLAIMGILCFLMGPVLAICFSHVQPQFNEYGEQANIVRETFVCAEFVFGGTVILSMAAALSALKDIARNSWRK